MEIPTREIMLEIVQYIKDNCKTHKTFYQIEGCDERVTAYLVERILSNPDKEIHHIDPIYDRNSIILREDNTKQHWKFPRSVYEYLYPIVIVSKRIKNFLNDN